MPAADLKRPIALLALLLAGCALDKPEPGGYCVEQEHRTTRGETTLVCRVAFCRECRGCASRPLLLWCDPAAVDGGQP